MPKIGLEQNDVIALLIVDKFFSTHTIELYLIKPIWRSARAVYWSGLENRRTCERTVGSNPTSS